MKRSERLILIYLALAFVVACLVFTAPGCGKKGDPVPPVQISEIPAVPTDLKYTVKDRELTLSWACASLQDQKPGAPVEGFEVFMATKPLDGCQGCPFIFKSVGTVSMPRQSFEYTLDQDLHYYFRVQTLGHDNIKSKVSDTVYIELP